MTRLTHLRGIMLIAIMFAACVSSQTNAADTLQLSQDGWYRWRVPSVQQNNEEETIYVLVSSGKPQEIEISGHWCNGRKHEPAIDLGLLTTDASIDWLQQYLGTRSDLSEDALAAISRHAGDRALRVLIDIVESDTDQDTRQEAIFWMAESESDAAFDYLDRLLMAK
jgi:hypothetical protein